MRRFAACLLLAFTACLAPGCGGASGIKEGIPENAAPPPNFDPGGGAQPDMSGKAPAPAPK